MGTTESIFQDEDTISSPMPSRETRSSTMVASSRIERSHGSRDEKLRSLQYRKCRPPKSSAKPVKHVKGFVLGCSKTGKRTLMKRLQGIDPFAKKDYESEGNRVTTSESTIAGESIDLPSVQIPYKPPSNSPTWDKIKLHVQYANTIDNECRGDEWDTTNIDFVVVMINPRDAEQKSKSNLQDILKSYLERLGYSLTGKGKESIPKPICMAILFNFRDLGDTANSIDELEALSSTDVELFVQNTLESYKVPERKRVIGVLETSLLNCYGLDGLHRFIYRAYLQRCESDLERLLGSVRNQLQRTSPHIDDRDGITRSQNRDTKKTTIPYDEFLKEISSPPKDEPISPLQRSKPDNQKGSEGDSKEQLKQNETASKDRNILPKNKNINRDGLTPTLRMGTEALEAFLASSSDEEDGEPPSLVSRTRYKPTHQLAGITTNTSSDSDSDDDDFFYDETGNRRRYHLQRKGENVSMKQSQQGKKLIDRTESEKHEDRSIDNDGPTSSSSENEISPLSTVTRPSKEHFTKQQKKFIPRHESSHRNFGVSTLSTDHSENKGDNEKGDEGFSFESSTQNPRIDKCDKSIDERDGALGEADSLIAPKIDKHDSEGDSEQLADKSASKRDEIRNGNLDTREDIVTTDLNGRRGFEKEKVEVMEQAEAMGSSGIDDISIEDEPKEETDAHENLLSDGSNLCNDAPVREQNNPSFDDGSNRSTLPNCDPNRKIDDEKVNSTGVCDRKVEGDDDATNTIPETSLDKGDEVEDIICPVPHDKDCVNDDESEHDFVLGANEVDISQFEDDNGNDDFVIREVPMCAGQGNDSEDEEFVVHTMARTREGDFVKGLHQTQEEIEMERKESPIERKDRIQMTPSSPSVTQGGATKPAPSNSISAAALAAIAAAQQEAESMIREQKHQFKPPIPQTHVKVKKSKKKKKDETSEKKKKKKKNRKMRTIDLNC